LDTHIEDATVPMGKQGEPDGAIQDQMTELAGCV
jgi:hypothetical protein